MSKSFLRLLRKSSLFLASVSVALASWLVRLFLLASCSFTIRITFLLIVCCVTVSILVIFQYFTSCLVHVCQVDLGHLGELLLLPEAVVEVGNLHPGGEPGRTLEGEKGGDQVPVLHPQRLSKLQVQTRAGLPQQELSCASLS